MLIATFTPFICLQYQHPDKICKSEQLHVHWNLHAPMFTTVASGKIIPDRIILATRDSIYLESGHLGWSGRIMLQRIIKVEHPLKRLKGL